MSDVAADAWHLAAAATALPHGPAQVALWEQAVALADAHHDDGLGYELRSDALWPMYHGNRADALLVHYAWCLAYLDRTPEEDPTDTLWKYRWVLASLADFATVTRAQIETAWADMKARYAANGYAARPVWLNRQIVACQLGDAAVAADAHRRYARARPGFLSDDPAQDARTAVEYQVFVGRDKAAVAAAGPYVSGHLARDESVPNVLMEILVPLARLGRWPEARAAADRAERLIRTRGEFLGASDELITFRAVTGDLAGAARLVNRHFAPGVAFPGEFNNISTYKHTLFVARRLAAAGSRVLLKTPPGLVPGADGGGRIKAGPFADWLAVELSAVCAGADARNGNDYHTGRLGDLDEWADLARKCTGVTA